MKNKLLTILKLILPIIVMVFLIPFVINDYLLAFIYIVIATVYIKYNYLKNDWLIYFIGVFAMIFFEIIFVSTGVETFTRNSLFGIMPFWLPYLWAFAFVIMRRCIKIIETL